MRRRLKASLTVRPRRRGSRVLLAHFGLAGLLCQPASQVRADTSVSQRAGAEGSHELAAIAPCADDLRLVGSVVIEARPDLSLAAVHKPSGTQVLAVGGRIDDFTLVSLESERAYLRSSRGILCSLSVFSARHRSAAPAPLSTPAASAAEAVAEPKGKAMFSREELSGGVRAMGGDRYRISKALFLRALGNPGGAAGGAYFRPVERAGQTIGMEVRAVRDGTALSAMGVHTGDVLRTINGIGLDNPVDLLAALRTAREADAVTLLVVRDGQERALSYLIE